MSDTIYQARSKPFVFNILACALRVLALAAMPVASVSFADAGELVIGIGQDNIDSDVPMATEVQFELHSDIIRDFGWINIAVMGVFEVDEARDTYLGLGVSSIWDITDAWFIEASLAAGYYTADGDSLDLGSDLQFRTLVGVGYRVSARGRLSIAVEHLSNAGIEEINPGRNAVLLRYGYDF